MLSLLSRKAFVLELIDKTRVRESHETQITLGFPLSLNVPVCPAVIRCKRGVISRVALVFELLNKAPV